ncbi:sigma-70 family RNA polymerase sigma factor family protein [Flindersiella endophytica]
MSDEPTQDFVEHRELLFSLVYNLLGSVTDTEDVLQETWLAWAARAERPGEPVANPRAYLVRIAVNQALSRRAQISRRQETYVGAWLPEPLLTTGTAAGGDPADPADPAETGESVSMALLVVLETLTPLERAVFVLHDVFGYSHPEIGGILDRTPAAIRQLAHRAREHVQARRPRFRTSRQHQREVTQRFIAAALGGDLAALLRLLAPDVTIWSDGGGPRPVTGRDKTIRLLRGYAARRPEQLVVRYLQVNHSPAALVFAGDDPYVVLVLDLTSDGEQIQGIYAIANPGKLTHLHAFNENESRSR